MTLSNLPNQYELTIIFVNYKSSLFLDECLTSLTTQTYKNFQIYIVDNTPGNLELDNLKNLKKKYTDVLEIKILKPKYNLGFAGGNNYALRRINSQFILLLNCDTELELDTIEKTMDYLRKNQDVGILCPKILYYNSNNILFFGGGKKNPGTSIFCRAKYNKIIETNYAIGTALFTRIDLIQKVGLLDEIFFMYYEETDWSFRAKKYGYKTIYFPKTIVYHKADLNYKKNYLHSKKNYFSIYLNIRNSIIFAIKCFSFFYLVFFISFFLLKTIIQEIFLSIKYRKSQFIRSLLRALRMGFLLGFRRRTNRNCRKLMRKEIKYLNKFHKISRSTQI
ncbi:MAG: glycosyltransferase family 2 protein [Promethearchaeota archaeon]